MKLADVRDYIESLGLSEHVYMGKLDAKKEKSIGVYHSRQTHAHGVAIGGRDLESYDVRHVTLLVHWSTSPREAEDAAVRLQEALESARECKINNETIKFIQLSHDYPIDVGTDDAGIYEMTIEAAFVFSKRKE